MKAVVDSPLICLIFSLLRNMPQLQPCLLVSARHQPNSRWGGAIIVQMEGKVEIDSVKR